MVHQLKVERSKSCGQFFLLPRGFLISFKYIALVNSPPERDFSLNFLDDITPLTGVKKNARGIEVSCSRGHSFHD